MSLPEMVSEFFRRQATPGPYLMAVSGGQDSMVLLEVMTRLFSPAQLSIAHFNHRLRGEEADGDAAFVESLAREKQIAFHGGAAIRIESSEEELRNARWEFLRRIRVACGASHVVTAHHLEDQLETFLMRLLRGTGMDGLSGMEDRTTDILRPLLTVGRAEIRAFAQATGLRHREDRSNSDRRYLRNQVRHELVPVFRSLSTRFGGEASFLARFQRTTEELGQVSRERRDEALRAWQSSAVETEFWFRLSEEAWRAWSEDLKGRVLRLALQRLGAPVPDRNAVEVARSGLDRRKPACELPGAVRLRYSCGFFYFQRPDQRDRLSEIKLVREGGRWECPALHLAFEADPVYLTDREVRFFRPGDRLGDRKLKTWFLERRVPQPERALLPLIARAGSSEVVWIFPQQNQNLTVMRRGFPFGLN